MKYEVANEQPVHYIAQQGKQKPQMHQGLENSFISSAFQSKPEKWHVGHPKKDHGTCKDKFLSGPITEIVCTCLGEKEFHTVVPKVMVISGSQKMWSSWINFLKNSACKIRKLTKYPSQKKKKKKPISLMSIQGSAEKFVREDLQKILLLTSGVPPHPEGVWALLPSSLGRWSLSKRPRTGQYSSSPVTGPSIQIFPSD